MRWETLTWQEIASIRRHGGETCLLPVGATEQHGPHLAVGMDSANAVLLCDAVSAKTSVPVLPAIRYVITLDADTELPRDSARQLVATIAHPLVKAEYLLVVL